MSKRTGLILSGWFAVAVISVVFCGCSRKMEEYAFSETQAVSEAGEEVQYIQLNASNIDTNINFENNHVYNQGIVYTEPFSYVCMDGGIYRINELTGEKKKVFSGNAVPKLVYKDYIYIFNYSGEGGEKNQAGVLRINIEDDSLEQVLEFSEKDAYLYRNMYVFQDVLYLTGIENKAYQMDADGLIEKDITDTSEIYQLEQLLTDNGDEYKCIIDFINNYINYPNLFFMKAKDGKGAVQEIYSINKKSGQAGVILEVAQYPMLTYKGLVFYDSENKNNIYLLDWNNERHLIYDSAENNGRFINIGNFDEDYVYGFYKDKSNNSQVCVRLSWEGGFEKLFSVSGVKSPSEVGLKISPGWLYYYDGQAGGDVWLMK